MPSNWCQIVKDRGLLLPVFFALKYFKRLKSGIRADNHFFVSTLKMGIVYAWRHPRGKMEIDTR